MKLEHSITPHTKINSKWIKHLNVRLHPIKLLEENIGRTLFDINHSKIFYDLPPRVIKIKTKISKWDLIKLKSFHTSVNGHLGCFHVLDIVNSAVMNIVVHDSF